MDQQTVKAAIEKILQSRGISAWGYCSAKPFECLTKVYKKRQMGGTGCEFEDRPTLASLTDPSEQLENAASFLVVLLPYGPYERIEQTGHGRMASGTASEDYHTVLGDILREVEEVLKDFDIHSFSVVDTSPLSDRSIAVRAGLGTVRRNSMFYHQQYGSYVYIGSVLMDQALHEKDVEPMNNPCGSCKRCQNLCPTGAVLGDGTINSNRCISYLTQKKVLTKEEMVMIGNQIYGCDVCQQVCPANRGVKASEAHTLVPVRPAYKKVLEMTNAEFKTTYKRTDAGWRGKRTLQRNVLAAIANRGRQEDYQLVYDFRPESPILKTAKQMALQIIKDKED